MLKNLLKTAIRNITKDLGYSSLNIMGLTIGIASALFLIVYVADEVGYDRYHEKADRIYRVSSHIKETDDEFTWIVAQIPFGPQVTADYPEVEAAVRFIGFNRAPFRYNDKEFYEDNFFYADTSVFDVFTYKFLKGDPKKALMEPNTMVVTETIANKYFGTEYPIGKVLVSGEESYRITAVIEDVPRNSHFRFDALSSRKSLPSDFVGSWGNFGVFTYLLFPEGFDVESFETKLQEMYSKYMAQIFERMGISIEYLLEPITKIHLTSTNPNEPQPTGSITYVYIFSIVAFFLILIAALNYMNLATARSARRAREVGLRKVVGSNRLSLIIQFLSESTTLTIISLVLSIGLVALLLPQFNLLAGKSFDLSILNQPIVLYSAISVIVIVGIIGGTYPAFYLSRFQPAAVLKGEITGGSSGNRFRKILVVFQFLISVTMIISTLVVYQQLSFLKTKDLGYEQSNILTIGLTNRSMVQSYPVFKQKLLDNPIIRSVTSTNTPLGQGSGKVLFNVESEEGMVERGVNFAVVDHDFVETLGIKMVKGRDFQYDIPADTLAGVLVNETFVKRMNWSEALGKRIETINSEFLRAEVVGVMHDYHQTGMYNEIETLMLLYRPSNNVIYIKIGENDMQSAIRFIEQLWHEIYPEKPFEYEFLADSFDNQFEADEKRGFIFTLFTILAIIIACLGLFGLASYTVERRTKEIGIRKVLGANEGSIIGLITSEFMLPVSIAVLIAVPVSYYFMNSWLDNYVYRTDLSAFIFVLAATISIIVTFVTISFKAYRAATMNPTESLRSE
jgi:putative ABC transport system permease protein